MEDRDQPKEIHLTIQVLLDESHPVFAQNLDYLFTQLRDMLLDQTQSPAFRHQVAQKMGLPENTPFRLTIMASRADHTQSSQPAA